MNEIYILGVRVDVVDREGLESAMFSNSQIDRPRIYAYVNIHAINIAQRDKRFRDFVNSAAVTYCDGEGVRLGAMILGRRLPQRTVLTYWIWDLCRLIERNSLSIYLLGGRPDVVAKAVKTLQMRFANLRIAGSHHGYFAKSGEESSVIVEEINRSGADVLFVGFGMPLQEHWIDDNRALLQTKIILPSGSMIDYIAGEKRPTPTWMARFGLEWLYRLSREPRRLWRRYLIGNPIFVLKILSERFHSGHA